MKNELREVLGSLDVMEVARGTGLRCLMHGVSAEQARPILSLFLRTAIEALSAEPDGDGERLSDAACDAIARALDAHGRDKLGYGGGLPAWDEECFIVMRHLIRDAARSAAQEK